MEVKWIDWGLKFAMWSIFKKKKTIEKLKNLFESILKKDGKEFLLDEHVLETFQFKSGEKYFS